MAHIQCCQNNIEYTSVRCPEKQEHREIFAVSKIKCMITDVNYPAPDEEMHMEAQFEFHELTIKVRLRKFKSKKYPVEDK